MTDADIRAVGRFIRRKRNERGLSAKQLASMAGVSDAHIIYIEKSERRPTFERLVNIIEALGSGMDELLTEIGRPGSRRIPVVTWVTAGSWREVCDSFEPGDADQWIESGERGPNVFALRVNGDSMEPEFKDGETITVNPHLEAHPGDYVVVKNPGGEATFKQLKRYGQRWVLHPLNPKYEDIEAEDGEFSVIGKVVKKEKPY